MNNKETNRIHPTAKLGKNVIIGDHNIIGENVVIEGFKGETGKIIIGDCNVIHENTRILAGKGGIRIGDWNVFHNSMLVMGENSMTIGHNCWFGQNTVLDSSGGLSIANGVRVGMYSQIWTHVASGELIEGCQLFGEKPSIIEDDVWLVGSCTVSSGVTLGKRGVFLTGSNITKSTEPHLVYAGSPAKSMEKLCFYQPVHLDDKFNMLKVWIEDFVSMNEKDFKLKVNADELIISNLKENETVIFSKNKDKSSDLSQSIFYVIDKTFNKTNSVTERMIYKFLYNYKARFLPK